MRGIPELKGGTGHSFDWSQFPKLDIPLILAGGLTPEMLKRYKDDWGLCCRCQRRRRSAKGIKDQQLIENFMQRSPSWISKSNVIDYTQYPDERGHFGIHGGRFVSETLMAALET